ncbi:MAG: hypothetical protein HFF62_15765 [Oscillospiraceae bacterium]|nr:hypothetical protein [Oscillospiraceae bacterium]
MANPKGNPENLKPVRTTDEAKKRGAAGGRASGAARRKKRDARSAISLLLNMAVRESLEENMEEMGFQEEDWTNMNAMWARIFTDAMSGDKAAQKMILDYGGFNPEFMLREKESKAKIRAMKEESERRTMYGDNVDGQRGDADDIQIYLPDNRRDDLK